MGDLVRNGKALAMLMMIYIDTNQSKILVPNKHPRTFFAEVCLVDLDAEVLSNIIYRHRSLRNDDEAAGGNDEAARAGPGSWPQPVEESQHRESVERYEHRQRSWALFNRLELSEVIGDVAAYLDVEPLVQRVVIE